MTDLHDTTEASSTPAGGAPTHRAPQDARVPAAKTPVSSAFLAALGLMWAVALVGVGLVCVHDALVSWSVLGGPSWLGATVEAVGALRPTVAMLVVATLVGLLGLALLWLSLRPRRKRGIAVSARSGTFLRHRDLSRLVAARTESLDGVVSAQASSSKRKVRVRVRSIDGVDPDGLRSRVEAQVGDDLAVLDGRVRTNVQVEGGHS